MGRMGGNGLAQNWVHGVRGRVRNNYYHGISSFCFLSSFISYSCHLLWDLCSRLWLKVLMNYRRKSTEGWSVGCIHLDIIGGVFSILQMLINAHNHGNCWNIQPKPVIINSILTQYFATNFCMFSPHRYLCVLRRLGVDSWRSNKNGTRHFFNVFRCSILAAALCVL